MLSEAIAEYEGDARRIAERVHLVALPMADVEENAAIVNALQRHADVVVQKSLAEGFGLTVAEAMWKARPVVASRIGGIQDQIVDGETGCCSTIRSTSPPTAPRFAAARRPGAGRGDGREARARARGFLGTRTLIQSIELYERHIRPAQNGAEA